MLAANPQLEVGARQASLRDGHAHHGADAFPVQDGEGIGVQDVLRLPGNGSPAAVAHHLLPVHVGAQAPGTAILPSHVEPDELRRVVAREPEGGLGEIVGPEGEKFGLLGDPSGGHGRPRQLDHGAHQVGELHVAAPHRLLGDLANQILLGFHLRHHPHQRDHDFRHDLLALACHLAGRFQDGAGLHAGDLRHRDAEPAASQAQHGIELMELLHSSQEPPFLLHPRRVSANELQPRDLHHQLFPFGQEFMERGVEQTNRHGEAFHLTVQPDEVLLLQREQLRQVALALFPRAGQDHVLHDRDPILGKEHMLGPAEPDPLGPEAPGDAGLLRHVRIGPDPQHPELVGPLEERGVVPILLRSARIHLAQDDLDHFGFHHRDIALIHMAGEPVDRERVALLQDTRPDLHRGAVFHLHRFAACDADLSHLPSDDCGMGGHPASRSQEPHRRVHPVDIVRAGLLTDQHDALTTRLHLDRPVRRQRDLPGRRARSGRQALAQGDVLGLCRTIKDWIQVLRELLRSHAEDRFAFADQAFLDHIHRDAHGRDAGTFPHPGLEHVELAFLNGKLQVQHVAVMTFEGPVGVRQLLGGAWKAAGEGADRERRPNPGHHILPLCVQQVLTEEGGSPGRRIAGERDAGSARVPHVAEHHGDHVHGGSPTVRNIVEAPVGDGPRAVP